MQPLYSMYGGVELPVATAAIVGCRLLACAVMSSLCQLTK